MPQRAQNKMKQNKAQLQAKTISIWFPEEKALRLKMQQEGGAPCEVLNGERKLPGPLWSLRQGTPKSSKVESKEKSLSKITCLVFLTTPYKGWLNYCVLILEVGSYCFSIYCSLENSWFKCF